MPVATPPRPHRTRPKARAAQRWLDDPEVGLLELLLSDRAEAPSGPLERDELAGVVRAAVAELADRQRTALELHQFHDRTYAQVAAELDMTPKAAKSLLYRARNHLRVALRAF